MSFETQGKKTLFVCTGNAGKLAEFRACFGTDVEVVGIRDLEARAGVAYVEPAEDADDFLLNAWTKVVAATGFVETCAKTLGVSTAALAHAVLVDDSGLCVPSLGFAPGVHSATYGGLPRDDAKNRKALQDALRGAGRQEAEAHFVCYLLWMPIHSELPQGDVFLRALSEREHEGLRPHAVRAALEPVPCGGIFEPLAGVPGGGIAFGYCTGTVRTEEQQLLPGAGHGYDAMFFPVNNPLLSFASVTMEEKNVVSHRAQALRALSGALPEALC
ncbi:MAG: hypothetical protein IOD12_17940 [Silvanigrellales bacterium]|nr:hypothetical protein [Silvanigrellales bacterium]